MVAFSYLHFNNFYFRWIFFHGVLSGRESELLVRATRRFAIHSF